MLLKQRTKSKKQDPYFKKNILEIAFESESEYFDFYKKNYPNKRPKIIDISYICPIQSCEK